MYIILSNYNYSSNNNQIDINKEFIDFFQLYFTSSDDPAKDIILRLYLNLLRIYIEYYNRFEIPLLEYWSDKMRPYLFEKYPSSNKGIFMKNSDIHFLIKLIDELKNKCGVKIENKQEKIEQSKNDEKKEKTDTKKNSPNKEQSSNNKSENYVAKISGLSENDDLKKLRNKIKSNISKFLEEFKTEKTEKQLKHANSMKSLRSSTITSLTTCDDSLYQDDNKEGRLSIDLKHLLVDNNNDLNISKKESNDMIHRSKNLKKIKVDEVKNAKNKSEELANKNKPNINILPKFNEVEIQLDGINIGFKDKEKTIIDYISIDLLLKHIIFEKYLEKYTLFIYHFSKQCFCFLDKEILFKKLFACYNFYKKKEIDFGYLKNLIMFINILVIEMIEYYEKIDYNEKHIDLIKKFYFQLSTDLTDNSKEKINKMENKIKDLKIDVNSELLINPNFHFDKNNLINTNLNLEINNINILLLNEKEEMNNSIENKNQMKKMKKIKIIKKIIKNKKRKNLIK